MFIFLLVYQNIKYRNRKKNEKNGKIGEEKGKEEKVQGEGKKERRKNKALISNSFGVVK